MQARGNKGQGEAQVMQPYDLFLALITAALDSAVGKQPFSWPSFPLTTGVLQRSGKEGGG